MATNPYDHEDTCTCSAWSEGECACGGFVDRGKVVAWDEGYEAGLTDAPAAVRAAQAEALAEELPKHHAGMGALPQQKGTDKERAGLRCSCGEWSAPCPEGDYTRPWGAFWQHVAEALADRLACCDGISQESASETSDAHTDTAAPEGDCLAGPACVRLTTDGCRPVCGFAPAAPVAVEGVETVEALRERVLALHPKIESPRHGCCAPPKLCKGHTPECGGRDHGINRPKWPCHTVAALSPVEPETSEPEGGES